MDKCFLCSGSTEILVKGAKDFFILKGKSPNFEIAYCPACQIAFSLPVLNNEELAASYPVDYEAYQTKKFISGLLQKIKYRSDLRLIRKVAGQDKNSLFEIGAGRGEFLAQARGFGFVVSGIEPGQEGRRVAHDFYHIGLTAGYADGMDTTLKSDIIVARHVFEHLGNPLFILSKIKEKINEGGLLFLKLPRLDSWESRFFKKYWSGYDLPRHRFHYSKKGMVRFLEKNGFSKIKIINESVPSDIIRSASYYCLVENNLVSRIFRLFLFLPGVLQMVLAQILALALSHFGTGRMIVTARLNKQ